MVAPITIKIINQNDVAIAARTNIDFKYINQAIIVKRASISTQITKAIGFPRCMVSATIIKIKTVKI